MDQDVEIEIKIKLYCRPGQIFELSVSPQTTLGEIVQALKADGDIDELPSVEKLKYNDYWKSSLTNLTPVGQLVPFKQQFVIQVTNQQVQSKIQFFPQQSGFWVNQQGYSKIQEQDSIEQKQQKSQQKFEQQSQSQQLNQIKKALEQYPKKGVNAFQAITNSKWKKIFNTFIEKLKNQGIQTQKSHDAYQSKLNTEKQLEIKQHKKVIKAQELSLKQQESKIQQLRRQMIDKKQQIDQLKAQLNQISQNNAKKLEQQIAKFKAVSNDLQIQVSQLKTISQDLKRQNQDLNKQIHQLKVQKKIKAIGPIIKQNSINNIQVLRTPLSISQLLYQNDSDGTCNEFLIKSLQNFKQAELKNMKLAYRLDIQNRTNFNNYIKGKTNLLILIHIEKNNKTFGAFLQNGLSEQELYGRAFLFSLNQKAIFLKQNESSITHENGLVNLIIGRADIVLNTCNKKVNVNKLIFKQNSSFKSQEIKKYDAFTGSDKTQVEVDSCEIYEVFFNK